MRGNSFKDYTLKISSIIKRSNAAIAQAMPEIIQIHHTSQTIAKRPNKKPVRQSTATQK